MHIESDWVGCYVAVWAMVDAGFQTFASVPLVLGRIEVPASKTSRKGAGKFLGGWM